MNLEEFSRRSGFKVLAVAGLNHVEYSIVLLLINYEATDLKDFITTSQDLVTTLNCEKKDVEDALFNLDRMGIVTIKRKKSDTSFRLKFQFNINKWQLDTKEQVEDAIVFPFIRHGIAKLKLFKQEKPNSKKAESTWQRVFSAYYQDQQLLGKDHEEQMQFAKLLVETHPVDQVLLILRHFGQRIPSLSLLASNWKHYQEVFEAETQKIDMLKARSSHYELDTKLKMEAKSVLDQRFSELTEDERMVLEILVRHQYPRRQLFWAYQAKSRYPQLKDFLENNKKLMLAVTSKGKNVPTLT
jgi:hypothetical protein